MSSRSDSDTDARAFLAYLQRRAKRVDLALDRCLPPVSRRPRVLHRAMRYTALSEGKRLRPVLVVLAYETCGGRGRRADKVGAALEMVHAFTLIHDDLPAMDDDDFRRGKPSSHKAFGEGVAILAGDALLTQAFQTLSALRRGRALGPAVTAGLVEELGEAAGSGGVVGGQVLDLLSEGTKVSRSTVDYIHRHKTARLFSAALRLGALAAEARPADLARLTRFGEGVGTAFQIVDDILGETGSFHDLGREPGRDRVKGKVTYPRMVGYPASHRAIDRLLEQAGKEARRLPANRELFGGFVEVVDRRRRKPSGELLRA